MSATAPIQIVDEHDQPLRGSTKDQAIANHWNRQIVRIMLVDGKGNVLLQKRAPTKRPYPNCWDNSVAGHVDLGETYDHAAHREIAEEIGLHDVDIDEIGYGYVGDGDDGELQAFVKVYKGTINELPTQLGSDEVSEVKWFDIDDLKRLIIEQPEQFTDGLRRVVTEYF